MASPTAAAVVVSTSSTTRRSVVSTSSTTRCPAVVSTGSTTHVPWSRRARPPEDGLDHPDSRRGLDELDHPGSPWSRQGSTTRLCLDGLDRPLGLDGLDTRVLWSRQARPPAGSCGLDGLDHPRTGSSSRVPVVST